MLGQLVLVRGYKDRARACRLVSVVDSTAQLTDEEGFNAIYRGDGTDRLVTFLLSDVFEYDQTVKNDDTPDWTSLTPLTERLSLQ